MTITFKPVDHPNEDVIAGILEIESKAFGKDALSEYVIVPLLYHGKVYVAVDDEENLVASAYFMRDMADIGLAYLMSVAVIPALRGHDVGTALLNYAFSHLKRFGITRVQSVVDPAKFDVLTAYREKMGFTVVDSKADESGMDEEQLIMEKEL